MRSIAIHIVFASALLSLLGILPLASNAAPGNSRSDNDHDHRYVVRIDTSMEVMTVKAQFAHAVTRIEARSRAANQYIRNVHECGDNTRIRIRGRRMRLPKAGVRCVLYDVDLAKAASEERRNLTLSDSNVVVSPAAWFWRPTLRGADSIVVQFEVDDSIGVSVPWQSLERKEKTYRVPASPESAMAPAAFGQFEYFETSIPGATLRITILQPKGDRIDDSRAEQIVAWVRTSAATVNLAYGVFPNPSPNILVLPVGGARTSRDSAVYFGRVLRDGGETVELLVNLERPISEYYEDWTATHEFGHLMLPYISSRYRWISEGFAQYYQNVLLARSGQYSEQYAWQKLYDGFERGRNSGPQMSPNDAAAAGMGSALMKIYWSGAAIALLADVELRQRSGGEESLDAVLQRLQACCLPSAQRWTGPEFFTKLDSLIDKPLFMPLYRRHANTGGFPALQPLLVRLGVDVDSGTVRLQTDTALADLRSSITACNIETMGSNCQLWQKRLIYTE